MPERRAKPRNQPRNQPRGLAELPYAGHLEPFTGELAWDGDYDTVLFEGQEFAENDAGSARFVESAFSSVTFTGGRFQLRQL